MAQSRMAGIAMGLGPDDLADVGEAATMATNKMGMEHGKTAGIMYDVGTGTMIGKNDGDPSLYLTNSRNPDNTNIKFRGSSAKDILNPGGRQADTDELLAFPMGRGAAYGSTQRINGLSNRTQNTLGNMYYINQ